jgi:hypothetical protein
MSVIIFVYENLYSEIHRCDSLISLIKASSFFLIFSFRVFEYCVSTCEQILLQHF